MSGTQNFTVTSDDLANHLGEVAWSLQISRGENMSFWVRHTADIGIRAFGRNKNDLLKEMTNGMQSLVQPRSRSKFDT